MTFFFKSGQECHFLSQGLESGHSCPDLGEVREGKWHYCPDLGEVREGKWHYCPDLKKKLIDLNENLEESGGWECQRKYQEKKWNIPCNPIMEVEHIMSQKTKKIYDMNIYVFCTQSNIIIKK